MATDIIGSALLDYQNGNYTEDLHTVSSLEEEDVLPLPYLFRDFDQMPPLEQQALRLCKGSVLDIGCGAGSHSVYLQQKGHDVTALDTSAGAIETCRQRGVKRVSHSNINDFSGQKFDTLLLLMNGIGVVGKLPALSPFLQHLKSLLKPDGQILLDSSNIIYMFEQANDGGFWVPDTGAYFGEVEYTMSYKQLKGDPFWWLYVDFDTLNVTAYANNLSCEMIKQGDHYDYLSRLTISEH
tara:strand:- start:3083 stop:3799 length:717 start_codon:yes stop_codon:yes gene_type:complete